LADENHPPSSGPPDQPEDTSEPPHDDAAPMTADELAEARRYGRQELACTFEYAQTPVYALPLVLLILTVFATVLEPLQNAISRRCERRCDRYALERTGSKAAYVSAFRKLARVNKADPSPHWLEVLLFHSHPPIARRLALAEER